MLTRVNHSPSPHVCLSELGLECTSSSRRQNFKLKRQNFKLKRQNLKLKQQNFKLIVPRPQYLELMLRTAEPQTVEPQAHYATTFLEKFMWHLEGGVWTLSQSLVSLTFWRQWRSFWSYHVWHLGACVALWRLFFEESMAPLLHFGACFSRRVWRLCCALARRGWCGASGTLALER